MEKIAIICPGPSLPLVWQPDFYKCYDKVIALSKAIDLCGNFPPYIWAVGDVFIQKNLNLNLLPEVWPKKGMLIFTDRSGMKSATEKGYHPVAAHEDWQPIKSKRLFTFPALLNYVCTKLYPSAIHCYGCDLGGYTYYTGVEADDTKNSADERWVLERKGYDEVRKKFPHISIVRIIV